MTTNESGKLNTGGVAAIKSILDVAESKRTEQQLNYLYACLTALAHQPTRWYGLQDWGEGGPLKYLASKGIELQPVPDIRPGRRSWYRGCGCTEKHWKVVDVA